MASIDLRATHNRKPKYVEIPTVPGLHGDLDRLVLDDGTASDVEEPDPALMAKLGLLVGEQRVSHVKTVNHPHPVLSHHAINTAEPKNKTTSPASTLSDKGIGSSVGSFDSELRNCSSAFLTSGAYDASRSGSLDSRRQELSLSIIPDAAPVPNHSRSSSDIIPSSAAYSSNLMQGKLAEQSSATMWNSDPRRGNSTTAPRTSSIRPKRPSTRRPKANTESLSMDRESSNEVVRLPQLCRGSPGHSARSSVSSSRSLTPAVSTCEIAPAKTAAKASKVNTLGNEPLPPPPPPPPEDGGFSLDMDLPPPPPPPPKDEEGYSVPPPLPPKASHFDNVQFPRQPTPPYIPPTRPQKADLKLSLPVNRAYSNPPSPYPEPHMHFVPGKNFPEDNAHSASATLKGRLRLSSDGSVNTNSLARAEDTEAAGRLWGQDDRRENGVPMVQERFAHLTTSMTGSGFNRAESMGRILGHGNLQVADKPFHGSNAALWDNTRQHSNSAPVPVSDHNDRNSSPAVTYDEDSFSRHSVNRSSTRSNPGDRRQALPDPKAVRFAPFRAPEVNLQPLKFELPLAITSETKFVGRDWAYGEMLNALGCNDSKLNKGVLITGASGQGKTSLIYRLVNYSYHGLRSNKQGSMTLKMDNDTMQRLSAPHSRSGSPMANSRQYYHPGVPAASHVTAGSNHSSRTNSPAFGSTAGSRNGSQTSLTEDSCRKVASQVVAFHFCQADNNTTCYVPEFIHSVAAQLTQAPQLTAYRELLLNEPHLQNLLSVRNCIQNPSLALTKAIIEPLVSLKQSQKLPRSNLVIVVDALNEAEQHRPDYGFSIVSFLHHHLPDFPDFIKVVATCRTEEQAAVENLPVHVITLDGEDPNVIRDAQLYISHRMASASNLANLTLSGKSDPAVAQKQLSQHLTKVGKCNFLYLRMTLDLIEQGAIVPKSSGFKIVPVSLNEVFLQTCNLRFMSYTSFDDVRDVIAVALASLYPLKDEQLYQAVCSGLQPNQLPWANFKQLMDKVSTILIQQSPTSGRTFFHPSFREWLIDQSAAMPMNGTLQSSSKFKVDVKRGYALLATVLSMQPPERLHKHATLELAHHVLKASMFKNISKQSGVSASERNANFMMQSSRQLTEALTSMRNLFFPNMKVSKLLLRAGANPNVPTQVFHNATPLAVVAHTGCLELAELLLMFGADVNLPASNGMSALTFASAAGRVRMVDLLLRYRPSLDQADHNGHTPLLHAISRGHSDVAKLILTCDLYPAPQHRTFAAQQALVAAATTGNIQLMEYLLDNEGFQCSVDCKEPINGETALTASAARGRSAACEFLIRKYKAKIELRNKAGFTPLLCAVKHGEWDAADLLLNCGAQLEARDLAGKTPLIMAAYSGHLGVLELLLSRGASVSLADREGLTALSWAALQGQAHCVRSLISRNANIAHRDASGRTALDLAAFFGDPQVVDLLLDAGADISHVDATGMCALDRAIGCQNIAVVQRLLRRGAQIMPSSWTMATGKVDVTIALLNQCLEDGNNLYKTFDFVGASDVYARALKHVGELSQAQRSDRLTAQSKLADLTAHLLLGYSRCLRKLEDLEGAAKSATRALELKPHWYEALYARARVLREEGRLQAALCDVMEAEREAPPHNLKEIKRLIERIKEETRKGSSRYMRSSSASSEVIPVPQPRQRVNSTSSYHGRDSRGPSPTPVAPAEMARSYQSRYGAHAPSQTNHHSNAHQLAPLYPGSQHPLRHGGSQENLAESTMSLARYPPEPSPVRMAHRGHNNVDSQRPGVPRTNPHVRHHRPGDFHRSVSEDPRHMAPSEHYHVYEGDDSRSLCGDIPYDVTRTGYEYAPHNGRRRPAPALMDPSRSSFVTDL